MDNDCQTIEIQRRYCGPPDSGNGGYCAGLLANALPASGLSGGAVEVTLKLPPPLDRPLEIRHRDGIAHLCDGDLEIAVARRADLALDVPSSPGVAAAQDAATRYVGLKHHLFPGCFVCGPGRGAGDGLRVFAGVLSDTPVAAAPWLAEQQYCDGQDLVAPEIIWAALDCPGYFGLLQPGLVALLGRMHGQIIERPRAGEQCVVTGWRLGVEGRKFFAGSALYANDGRVLAKARAIWIQLDRERFQVSAGR